MPYVSPLSTFSIATVATAALLVASGAQADVLGLKSSPLHIIVVADMTGSSKNPAFQYAQQAKLIAQNVLLNQVRSGDTVTLLQVCSSVKTIADFEFLGNNAKLNKSDILRYSGALITPCKGKGSALTAGFNMAARSAQKTPQDQTVVVYFTDGAFQDDPQSAQLGATFAGLLAQKNVKLVFLAGLSPETASGGAGSIRDAFNTQLKGANSDSRVLEAGAYDLRNIYPSFAARVKALRK